MSTHRLRLAAATIALVAAAPLASLGTAHAAQVAEAKPERTITIQGVKPEAGVFFVKGRVTPDYKERFAVVQRKLKREDEWDNFRKFKTTDESRYRERVYALNRPGVVCYRVKIKGNDTFATSYSGRVCIHSHRA